MRLGFLILLLTLSAHVNAQRIGRSVIGSIGSSASKNGLLIQSTIGQPAITGTSASQSGLIIRQGFHQSYPEVMPGIEDLTITLFPNPSNGVFHFYTDLDASIEFYYYITDTKGTLVNIGSAAGSETVNINISQMANGIYYLNIVTSKGSGFFKISKTI